MNENLTTWQHVDRNCKPHAHETVNSTHTLNRWIEYSNAHARRVTTLSDPRTIQLSRPETLEAGLEEAGSYHDHDRDVKPMARHARHAQDQRHPQADLRWMRAMRTLNERRSLYGVTVLL